MTKTTFDKPSGFLVHLTRLNVPCDGGGFIKFINDLNKPLNQLCGKLEELPINDRTLYFLSQKNSSVKIHKNPLFSFSYKLVDYCYNITLTDRNNSFFLQPKETLECYFKIHLPYGNKIILNLITNLKNQSDSNIGDFHELIDLSAPSSDIINKNFNIKKCRGILIIIEMDDKNDWLHCIESLSLSKKIKIISKTNKLIIRVVKNLNGDIYSSVSFNSIQPSLFIEYNAQSIDSIVSQCAFGWIASKQFCVSAIEKSVTWSEAEFDCTVNGGHLASIRSDSEQKIIDKLLLNSPGYKDYTAYWIGATDKSFEGDFRWSDGFSFTYSSRYIYLHNNFFFFFSNTSYFNFMSYSLLLLFLCVFIKKYFKFLTILT